MVGVGVGGGGYLQMTLTIVHPDDIVECASVFLETGSGVRKGDRRGGGRGGRFYLFTWYGPSISSEAESNAFVFKKRIKPV
jgi:hypothetical protein